LTDSFLEFLIKCEFEREKGRAKYKERVTSHDVKHEDDMVRTRT
jgi:hypothetical protein